MEGWIPPRLRGLLRQDLGIVDEAALRHIIGLPEDTDLEFKVEAYEATTGQAKEAAYDIAGLANAGGGHQILSRILGCRVSLGAAAALRRIETARSACRYS